MSQQEFMPEPQHQQGGLDNAEIEANNAQPYYWSTSPAARDMPKNEHPSTYEESIPPYSYAAQNSKSSTEQARVEHNKTYTSNTTQAPNTTQRQQFSPDGDAFEYGYRPNTAYATPQQAPHWARPQRNRSVGKIIFLVIMLFLFARPILFILMHFIFILGFIVFLPILIILGILSIFAVFALIVLASLGISLHPRQFRRRNHRGRGWGW